MLHPPDSRMLNKPLGWHAAMLVTIVLWARVTQTCTEAHRKNILIALYASNTRTHPYNKTGSTRRERTTVSSRAWDPPSPVYAASPAERRGRRGVSSRRASAALEDRSVYVPPTRKPPPRSHRVYCAPGQVRAAPSTGQSVEIEAKGVIFSLYHGTRFVKLDSRFRE